MMQRHLTLLVTSCLLAHAALAQTPATNDAPATSTTPATNAPAATTTNAVPVSEFTALPASAQSAPAPDAGKDLITVDLDDVALIDVVRMFSRLAGANIIANPETLTARVTVNLDKVEWRPALSSILAMHGLALVERKQGSGVYSVIEQPPNAPDPMIVETIFLDYATVDEVSSIVERMLSGGASISTFPSRNAMVIRETENNLSEIKLILEKIDIQSRQVVVETQFMELNDQAIKQLGVRWDSLAELALDFQAGPFSTTRNLETRDARMDGFQRRENVYTIDASDQRFDIYGDSTAGGAAFTQPDGAIDVQYPGGSDLVGITYPDSGDIGSTPNIDPGSYSRDTREQSQLNYAQGIQDTARSIVESSAAVLNATQFQVALSALKTTDGVSIVSNPKIIVSSGSTNAFFSVGDREPIIKTQIERGTQESPGDIRSSELDTAINTDFIEGGYLSTGIELLVVPTVKTDDLIEALISPSLRRKIGSKEIEGNSWPVIAVKEIRTKFTLKSGQTVAIGGLTDTQNAKQTSKVPLLGDIPIIGKYLFSHERDETTQRETIIFVTLGLADPMEMGSNEGIPERAELVHKRQLRDRMRRVEMQAELEDLREAARTLEGRFEKQGLARDASTEDATDMGLE